MSTATLTAVTLAAGPTAAAPRGEARRTTDHRPAERASAPLVLTRRGRRLLRAGVLAIVTVLLAVGLVLAWVALAATVAPGASAGDGSPSVVSGVGSGAGPTPSVQVVVGPGDTLWELARDHAPDRDPRSVVDDIVRLNGLGSAGVQAGAVIEVPTR